MMNTFTEVMRYFDNWYYIDGVHCQTIDEALQVINHQLAACTLALKAVHSETIYGLNGPPCINLVSIPGDYNAIDSIAWITVRIR